MILDLAEFVLLLPVLIIGITRSYMHRSGTFFEDGRTDGYGG